MKTCEKLFDVFALLLITNIDTAPIDFQIELIDLQSNPQLKAKFSEVSLLDFYNYSLKMATLFESNYL